MSSPAEKSRALRLERLRSTLAKHLGQPQAAVETLVSELQADEPRPELWETLHAAADRDGKELELADAYRKVATERRLKQLSPAAQAQLLMHAADFHQGVIGDADGAEALLQRVLEVVPDHAEAFSRLEPRFQAAGDKVRLVELYATVAAKPPKAADELARRVLTMLAQMSPKTPVSDAACKRLLAFVPVSAGVLRAVEDHCRKTNRLALACALLEQAIAGPGLSEATVVEQRRRLIELYIVEANTPEGAIAHVEALLRRDATDPLARGAAERLLSNRAVASRAAAALGKARRQNEMPPD